MSVSGSSHGSRSGSPVFGPQLQLETQYTRASSEASSHACFQTPREDFQTLRVESPLERATRVFQETKERHTTISAQLGKVEREISAFLNGGINLEAIVHNFQEKAKHGPELVEAHKGFSHLILGRLLETKKDCEEQLDQLSRNLCYQEMEVYLKRDDDEACDAAREAAGGVEGAINLEAFFKERLRAVDEEVSRRIDEGWFPSANLDAEIRDKAAVSDTGSVVTEDDWEIEVRQEAVASYRQELEDELEGIIAQKELQFGRFEEGRRSLPRMSLTST